MKYLRKTLLCGSALAIVSLSAPATADTVTYSYDALGRLIGSSVSGGTASGTVTTIGYDPAGNRANYQVNGASGTAAPTPTPSPTPTPTPTPTPSPTPTPTPTPSAPTPLNPTFNFTTATSNVIALGSLASSSGSAAITSFSPSSGAGSATIASGGQSVTYIAPNLPQPALCEPAYTNTYSVPYSVQSTPNGASASGTATMNIKSQPGPRPGRNQQCP